MTGVKMAQIYSSIVVLCYTQLRNAKSLSHNQITKGQKQKKRQEIKRPDAQAGKTPEFPCYRVQTARAPQWIQL